MDFLITKKEDEEEEEEERYWSVESLFDFLPRNYQHEIMYLYFIFFVIYQLS